LPTRTRPDRYFNRSYCEDVLITRVHPEILHVHGLPDELIEDQTIWEQRYRSISNRERHLHRNGTRIVKIFLHLSIDEQAKRIRAASTYWTRTGSAASPRSTNGPTGIPT